MKFRTEIENKSLKAKIDYSTTIFAIGSCFAQNIAQRLSCAKFKVSPSPLGILFNPASIAKALRDFELQSKAKEERLVYRSEGWVTFDSHSLLAQPSREAAIEAYNNAIIEGHQALSGAQSIIITLGTAWVYIHRATDEVVANCHKVSPCEFERKRLSVEEIVSYFRPLLKGILRDKNIIFTVSPVRHISDGLADNALSKATLRVAIAELCEEFSNVEYFPAFEIIMDDLRDYRFYTQDLIHPSEQAIEYIWERFAEVALSDRSKQLLPTVTKIITAASHRPLNPYSQEHKSFCKRYLDMAKSIPDIDFSNECAFFEQYCHKS